VRLEAHSIHVNAHGGGTDEQPPTNAARLDLAHLQQATHGAGGDAAKLSGDLFKRPEQRVCHG